VQRLCSAQRLWSVHSNKYGLNRQAGPPVHDDLLATMFVATRPHPLWRTDVTEQRRGRGDRWLLRIGARVDQALGETDGGRDEDLGGALPAGYRQAGVGVEGLFDLVGVMLCRGSGTVGGIRAAGCLARAPVLTPQVLLLDEPFSQLDAGLRVQMRALVRALHEETKVTTVFVTHDQAEAVEVADSITLLLDGKLAGNGPPEAFYTAPPSLAAARFFGVTNELAGRVSAGTFRGLGC